MLAQLKWNRHSSDTLIAISIAVMTLLVKDAWKSSPAIKELHAKHYTLLTCLHGYLLMQPKAYFVPEPEDVFVVSNGRSGTMLMFNLLHQLRTGGDHNFDDIMTVGQHFTELSGLGDPSQMNQPQFGAPPRLFFSHAFPWNLPHFQRAIYVIRDPVAVVRSWYHLIQQTYQLSQPLTIEEFFYHCFLYNCFWPDEPYFHHVTRFWSLAHNGAIQKSNPANSDNKPLDSQSANTNSNSEITAHSNKGNALFAWFHFEDLIRDENLPRILYEIATHLNISDYSERTVLRRVQHGYYLRNPTKFDMHDINYVVARIINRCMLKDKYQLDLKGDVLNMGLQSVAMANKTIPVPENIVNLISNKWSSIVSPVLGFKSYQDMLKHSQEHRFIISNSDMFGK